MLHALEKRVLANIRNEHLSVAGNKGAGGKGIVAVSGGADSVALMHLLHALRDRLGLTLEVLHFNHGLREESPREAEWVAERAARLGLAFHLRESSDLKKRRGGFQEAARDWRRGESRKLLDRIGAQWIATGHHQDDQTETILLKLMRGAHLGNLRGMDWRTGVFVRPLLNISHAELADYLNARGTDWLEDPSNRDAGYLRNRVRNELVPLLDQLAGGGIAGRLNTLAAQAQALRRLLEGLLAPDQSPPDAPVHWISAPGLGQLPEMAATTTLHAFVAARIPGAISQRILGRAWGLLRTPRTGWTLHLSKGRRLRRAGERLMLETRLEARAERREMNVLEQPGQRIEYPVEMALRICQSPCGGEDALLLHNVPPGVPLLVRPRAHGDRFHPAWKASPVKVKDFLRDQHVPLWQRETMACVVMAGKVIAIYPKFVARGFESARTEVPPFCLHLGPC